MLKDLIYKPNNKETALEIIGFVGDSPKWFAELMECFIAGSGRVSQTTSWALQKPELIARHHATLLAQIYMFTILKIQMPNYKTKPSKVQFAET